MRSIPFKLPTGLNSTAARTALLVVTAGGLGAGLTWWLIGGATHAAATASAASVPVEVEAHLEEPASNEIALPKETWSTAGLRMATPHRGSLASSIHVTGRIALDEDCVAHVFPLVEGRVKSVHVGFGESVRAGTVLATVESKEVGQAKLDLLRDRQQRTFAQVNYDWNQQVSQNTQALIDALERGASMDEIERAFALKSRMLAGLLSEE